MLVTDPERIRIEYLQNRIGSELKKIRVRTPLPLHAKRITRNLSFHTKRITAEKSPTDDEIDETEDNDP